MFDIILILANYLHSKLIQYIVTFISSFFCALCNRKRIANIVVMALIAKAYQNMKHYHTTSLLLQWLSSLPSRLTQNGNNEKSDGTKLHSIYSQPNFSWNHLHLCHFLISGTPIIWSTHNYKVVYLCDNYFNSSLMKCNMLTS